MPVSRHGLEVYRVGKKSVVFARIYLQARPAYRAKMPVFAPQWTADSETAPEGSVIPSGAVREGDSVRPDQTATKRAPGESDVKMVRGGRQ